MSTTLTPTQTSTILPTTLSLLQGRSFPKTACPSEIARSLSRSHLDTLNAEDWRAAMSSIRQVLFELRDRGEVEILQKGIVVDDAVTCETVRGPIRVRFPLGRRRKIPGEL
ncbi:hypothetical protein BCR34DRAFT_566240 [Clohesyomyces aquaticus]|uniref:DUF3253 domain-containing protein n=1 Tax=Clohesyomyces aquaticus TaxID=1231657 RepID=A0A1Y1ZKM0_9PLEO|nr:hypothetical protein BCR34DRAFT_566240 [Clohesyomyces aquaticus]